MFGPLLLVIFINDFPNLVDFNLYLFADDSKNVNTITQKDDTTQLQIGLNKLLH